MYPGFVYFIRPDVENAPVKIGYSRNPEQRLKTSGFWVPFPLVLVAKFPGDTSLESRVHHHLLNSHSHYEWFHWTSEVEQFVGSVLDGSLKIENLPPDLGAIRFVKMRYARDAEASNSIEGAKP